MLKDFSIRYLRVDSKGIHTLENIDNLKINHHLNNKNVYGIHFLFTNIKNGGHDAIRGQNPIFESIDRTKLDN